MRRGFSRAGRYRDSNAASAAAIRSASRTTRARPSSASHLRPSTWHTVARSSRSMLRIFCPPSLEIIRTIAAPGSKVKAMATTWGEPLPRRVVSVPRWRSVKNPMSVSVRSRGVRAMGHEATD